MAARRAALAWAALLARPALALESRLQRLTPRAVPGEPEQDDDFGQLSAEGQFPPWPPAGSNPFQRPVHEDDFVDMGAGCCKVPRDIIPVFSSYVKGGQLACFAKCKGLEKQCGYVVHGWAQGTSGWCQIYAPCVSCHLLDMSPDGCDGFGNDGVHTFQYTEKTMCWEDMGPGCCNSGGGYPVAGSVYTGNLGPVGECINRCLELGDSCGYINHGWQWDNSPLCVVFPPSLACAPLQTGSNQCGTGGNDGVHSIKYNEDGFTTTDAATTTTRTRTTWTSTTITTTTYTTVTWVPPSAHGDPHVVNTYGQHYDIRKAGVHDFLVVPRNSNTTERNLWVKALVKRVRGSDTCHDRLYIRALQVSGKWLSPLKQLEFRSETRKFDTNETIFMRVNGGPNLTLEEFLSQVPRSQVTATRSHPELPQQKMRHVDTLVLQLSFGPARLKIGWAYTRGPKINWLWIQAEGLHDVPENVGGLLGEDDHTDAEEDTTGCYGPFPPSWPLLGQPVETS